MKIKYVVLASAFLFSGTVLAQKDEIKAAEKSLKNGNAAEAKASLDQAESKISGADDSMKAQFYFLKGNALMDIGMKTGGNDLVAAAKAFQESIAIEKASKKNKYTKEAQEKVDRLKGELINASIKDNQVKNYKASAEKLYNVYLLDESQPLYLYYAAGSAVNGQDYDTALNYYNKLKELNYSGEGTFYSATSKLSGEDENFASLAERDKAVKLGTHENPKTIKEPSKRGEIYKNIALIYSSQGKNEEAKKAIVEARAANPDDFSLLTTEANLYLQSKDMASYKRIMDEVIAKNPSDPNIYFNLGVIAADAKEYAKAEEYYKKAISLDPNYVNAYLNLSVMKLSSDNDIVEEMNKLGNTPKENKRYDELKAKRQTIFESTIPYLKKANELDPKNEDVARTLINVYNYLEMTSEAKALKAKSGL
ncbi:tetratricopeptide repeat protein [Flavobacterium sp. NST-5]|uniref:Tetratricopeptide repeat protein n=1 Tax=Flavobacterium ichthyis TaxID=2698827 RepID=A0ABW9ZAQ7_9FLAO|nr:tetratricopeptide repeat protein [Flavobacterium ichthyis]NBL65195.1 tetratricopeptide repeat protein [Flavobacterium ichthyis]